MASYLYDFTQADGAPVGLTVTAGSATVVSNELQIAPGVLTYVIGDDILTVDNYVADVDITPGAAVSSGQRPGIIFHYQNTSNFYRVVMKTGAFGGLYLYRYKAFTDTLIASDPLAGSRNLPNSVTYNIKVDVTDLGGNMSVDVLLDDVLIFSHTDAADPIGGATGQIGVFASAVAGDTVVYDNLNVVEGDATPQVVINESTQTVMAAKDDVTYQFTATATATDAEDGDLTGSIVWETSLDGGGFSNIGSGGSVTYDFPIGVNVIRASATDTGTNTGTQEITLTVEAFDFGGTIPVANGFILGIGGTHTPDEYTGNGVNLMITQQPTNANIFARADGTVAVFPNTPADTSISFSYRIEDQEGVSNESTITVDIST